MEARLMHCFTHISCRKAQGTIQYALAIAFITGALIVMYQYVGRGLQGRLKDSVDSLGRDFNSSNIFPIGDEFNATSTSSEGRSNFGFSWESKKGHAIDVRTGSTHVYSKLTVPPEEPTVNCDISQAGCKAVMEQQKAVDSSALKPLEPTTPVEYTLEDLVGKRQNGEGFDEGNQSKMDNGASASSLENGDYRSYELPMYDPANVDVNRMQADMENKIGG